MRFNFGMDVQVGRRKTPDGSVVAEWYPRVFVANFTLAMAIDPGEAEVGGEDGTEEDAEDAHVQPALYETESPHRRMGRPAGLLLERVTAPAEIESRPRKPRLARRRFERPTAPAEIRRIAGRSSQGFCSSVQPRPSRSRD